jgi:hypothetical protein
MAEGTVAEHMSATDSASAAGGGLLREAAALRFRGWRRRESNPHQGGSKILWSSAGKGHLVDTARQYEARRFDAVVVPANIAAEAAITPVVTAALATYGTADSREAFLRK